METEIEKEEMNRLVGLYRLMLPRFLKEHNNEFVVLSKFGAPEFYKNFETASEEGVKKYGLEKVFIIQEITEFEPMGYVASAI